MDQPIIIYFMENRSESKFYVDIYVDIQSRQI